VDARKAVPANVRRRLKESEKTRRQGVRPGFGEAVDALKKYLAGDSLEQGGQSPEK